MAQKQHFLQRIYREAMQALENPPLPSQYGRPSDLFLVKHLDANFDSLHVWFDPEKRTSLAKRIFWRRPFDEQRFLDPIVRTRYGQEEIPTIKTIDYAPPYDDLQRHLADVLGAIPTQTLSEDEAFYNPVLRLFVRLPLSEISVVCNRQDGAWELFVQRCLELRKWFRTLPAL